jgi:hypothetical protein
LSFFNYSDRTSIAPELCPIREAVKNKIVMG